MHEKKSMLIKLKNMFNIPIMYLFYASFNTTEKRRIIYVQMPCKTPDY